MRIVAVSDLHTNLPEIPPCDLLIIAGDVCMGFGNTPAMQREWLRTFFYDWLKEVPAKNIVLTAGNHDFAFQEGIVGSLPGNVLIDKGMSFINEDEEKWHIWGSPWTRGGYWAYELSNEKALDEKWDRIPEGTDIIVTHMPPYGSGDGKGLGSMGLTDRILKIKPKLVVCGHIHPGYGEYKIGDTLVVNAALVNNSYQIVRKPVEIDLWK